MPATTQPSQAEGERDDEQTPAGAPANEGVSADEPAEGSDALPAA